MINTEKIVFDEPVYFMPNFSGPVKISILKLLDNGNVLVKQSSKKKDLKPFTTQLAHIYNEQKDANRGCRSWQSSKKRSKK